MQQTEPGPLGPAKPLEDTNLEEIVQLLRLLQEAMRISLDAETAHAKYQFATQYAAETQSTGAAARSSAPSAFQRPLLLVEGSQQAMRCAHLLAYLMLEFEVPVIVRHAMRCASIFLSGAVDFEKLELRGFEAPSTAQEPGASGADELRSSCPNQFLLGALTKIGA